MRYAARTDDNKAEIVSCFLSMGCSVYDLKMPVDLLVGKCDVTMLVEIKDGRKVQSARRHTPAQVRFMASWKGGPVATVTDVESAARVVRLMESCQRFE